VPTVPGASDDRTPRLTPSARLVLHVLEQLASETSDGVPYAMVSTIADVAGVSVRSARDGLRRLEALGLLETELRLHDSSRYHLTPDPAESTRQILPPRQNLPPTERGTPPMDNLFPLEPSLDAQNGANAPREGARTRKARDPLVGTLRSLYFAGASSKLISVWIGQALETIRAMAPDVTSEELERRHAEAQRRFGDHRVVKLAEHWLELDRAPQVGAPRQTVRPGATPRERTDSDVARFRAAAAAIRAREAAGGSLSIAEALAGGDGVRELEPGVIDVQGEWS
jgi:DNA-binding MarR family transcriptional regulator